MKEKMMGKTTWSTNFFFTSILFTLSLMFFIISKDGIGLTLFILAYLWNAMFTLFSLDLEYTRNYKKIKYLKTHIWFYYVFIPFTTYYDSYEFVFGEAPDLFKKKTPTKIKDKKINISKEKDTYFVSIEGVDDIGTLHIENNNPLLIDALEKVIEKNELRRL